MRAICITCSLIALLTSGCLVGPDHCDPGADLPEAWERADGQYVTQDWSEVSNWWYQFEDDTLNLMVDEATRQNLGLEEAAYRVLEARFQRGVVRSSFFPQISHDGSYTFSKTAIQGGFFGQIGGFGGIDVSVDDWSQAFNGAMELDVWGRIRRNVEAADADTAALVWAYRDTMVLLVADVATFYVEARAFQQRLEVALQNLESQRETLRIAEDRLKVETYSRYDVEPFRANVYTTEAEIPSLRVGYRQAINRLSVLLGRPPGYVDELMSQSAPIPRPPMEVAVGIPADLLRRRPDIRSAERNLAAQTARIGVAEAELYPQFSLSGSFGVNAQDLSQIYTTNGIAASVGPAFSWNILNFGQVRFNIRVQEARAAQLVLAYQQTVLGAAEEVDNSLVAYNQERIRLGSLQKVVAANEETSRLVNARFEAGGVSDTEDVVLRRLDIERQLFAAQDQLVVSKASLTQNLIDLYRSLGGGWEWSTGDAMMQGVIEVFPEIEAIEPGGEMVPPGEGTEDGVDSAEPGASPPMPTGDEQANAALSTSDSSRNSTRLREMPASSPRSPALQPPVRIDSEAAPVKRATTDPAVSATDGKSDRAHWLVARRQLPMAGLAAPAWANDMAGERSSATASPEAKATNADRKSENDVAMLSPF